MRTLSTIFVVVFSFLASPVQADSPLTSTAFHQAYDDEPRVVRARQGLTQEVLADLADPSVPHDVRAAMVNALGWSTGGQDHARRFVAHLASRHNTTATRLGVSELNAAEALALGYMVAMDDYLDLRPIGGGQGPLFRATATRILNRARSEAPDDFSVALIRALVRAQSLMHKGTGRWCTVHREVDAVVGGRMTVNMRPAAVAIITGYMNAYASYC